MAKTAKSSAKEVNDPFKTVTDFPDGKTKDITEPYRRKRKFKNDKKAKKQRTEIVIQRLSELYPHPTTQLNHEDAFQLLVATILSAQCTDARVNIVTKELFKRYSKPADFVKIPIEELEKEIHSTGFYKAKAKNIKGMAAKIVDEHKGKVPGAMEELLELPGVGRKTANVILGSCFNQPGVVVDTHVKRISARLAIAESSDPDKIEFELNEFVPVEQRLDFSHYLIFHGRETCIARRPKCERCIVNDICPSSMV